MLPPRKDSEPAKFASLKVERVPDELESNQSNKEESAEGASKESKDGSAGIGSFQSPFSRISASGATTTALKWLLKQDLKDRGFSQELIQQQQMKMQELETGDQKPERPLSKTELKLKKAKESSLKLKKKEQQQVQKLSERMQKALLLKNNLHQQWLVKSGEENLAGTATMEFRKNKEISTKWSSAIESICENREQKIQRQEDLKKKEKEIKEMFKQRFKEEIKQKEKKIFLKQRDFKLFKIIKKHHVAGAKGSPKTQILNALQNLEERNQFLSNNPNLKFVFNKHTGNYYTLKLEQRKKPSEKKRESSVKSRIESMRMSIQQKNPIAVEDFLADHKHDSFKESKEKPIQILKKLTLMNQNVNNFVNFYSQKTLRKDFQKVFGSTGLGQQAHIEMKKETKRNFSNSPSLCTEFESEEESQGLSRSQSDHSSEQVLKLPSKKNSNKNLTSPFLKMQLGLGIQKVIEEKKEVRKEQSMDQFYMDELLYKSFKRSRVRTSSIMNELRKECHEARNGNFINMNQKYQHKSKGLDGKPDRDKQMARSDRLSVPKLMQTVQFFGIPRKPTNLAFANPVFNQRVQSSQNLHEDRGSRMFNELGSPFFGSRNSAQKVTTAFSSQQRSGSRGMESHSEMEQQLVASKDQRALSQVVQGLRQIQSKEVNKEGVNIVYQKLDNELHRLFSNSKNLLNIRGPILMSKFQSKKTSTLGTALKTQLTAKKNVKSVTFKKEIVVSDVDQESDPQEEKE